MKNKEKRNLIDSINEIREEYLKQNGRYLTEEEVLDLVDEARKVIREEEQKKLEEAINKIKETSFYKEYIDKLYICDEDRDRIIYSAKKVYESESENKFLNELGEDFPYILFDICYMDYLESGKPSLTLKEI